MSPWDWNGARWWRFDIHTHPPASDDYGKGPEQAVLEQRTPREWLLDYMRAGVDCVAVTDHNTGAWIDRLKSALADLEIERPEGYREIHLFPGVEISVNGGVHLLAILPGDKTTSDVDSLLGAAGFGGGKKGSCADVTSKAFGEVVAEIVRLGGIPIPAHVDGEKGLFSLTGTTLAQALGTKGIVAMEELDAAGAKPEAFSEKELRWTSILGSDSHHPPGENEPARASGPVVVLNDEGGSAPRPPLSALGPRYPGSHFTWIKMGKPTIEGLRLALLDGVLSVRRSDDRERLSLYDVSNPGGKYVGSVNADTPPDPNRHAPLALESLEVSNATYLGRARSFSLRLNPWLNAIVGGRGTGKSSLIEFLRLALRRHEELPDELKAEFEKYGKVNRERNDGGLLTEETTIRAVYRKDGSRFRVQWSPGGDLDPIEEDSAGVWRRAEGDVIQRFPIRMYSQKQIFHLAKAPMALLGVVDEAPQVGRRAWNVRWREEESRFLSLRAKARQLEAGLEEEVGLKGELEDVKRRLAVFEEAGHADTLRSFQRRRRQQRAVETWEEGWAGTGDRLRLVAGELVPDELDDDALDAESEEDAKLRESAAAARDGLDAIRQRLENLAREADRIRSEWQTARDGSTWQKAVDAAVTDYESLRGRLAEEGVGDPSAYGELVQRRQTIERRLTELGERKKEVASLRQQAVARLNELVEIRRDLTEARRVFLQDVLKENEYVRIEVIPYGARETVEAEFRRLIQREGGGFERDIGAPGPNPEPTGRLGRLYGDDCAPEAIERKFAVLKTEIHSLAEGTHDPAALVDNRFATHVARLHPEALDRLDLWFPEDSLAVQYSPTGDGKNLRSIEEGSPGQKTAALLAFLLSYGDEPLVLDQPEDDLDNHLIYELIVTQLRDVKRRRQIIVVTHNPNIVVNGDAELVLALVARTGETHAECEGSLQERRVRDTICEVMEGGPTAFQERYRRITLEDPRV